MNSANLKATLIIFEQMLEIPNGKIVITEDKEKKEFLQTRIIH